MLDGGAGNGVVAPDGIDQSLEVSLAVVDYGCEERKHVVIELFGERQYNWSHLGLIDSVVPYVADTLDTEIHGVQVYGTGAEQSGNLDITDGVVFEGGDEGG